MENLGYYNGKIGLIQDMTIPMNDRAVYFGDGVYDAAYSANHTIFALEDHIDRFFRSLALLEIPFSMSKAELSELLLSLIEKVNADGTFVYWQATRGTGMRNHVYPEGPSNLMVMISPALLTRLDKGFKMITVEDTRFLHCNIKTLNLIPSVMAAEKAKKAGCDEAIFHRGDIVTECAHSNVSIIQNGVFRTAPLNNLILPGTARKHLLSVAQKVGIPTDERAFTLNELFDADEVMIHSSGTICNQITEIDGKPVGGKAPDVLKKLQDAAVAQFEEYTHAKFADYAKGEE